jgi:hypothetical protein
MLKTTAIYYILCNVNHDNKKEKKRLKNTQLPGDRKKQLELIDIESVLYDKHLVDRNNKIVLSRQTPEKTEEATKN